jgi:3-dehydroquinate dehydratase II
VAFPDRVEILHGVNLDMLGRRDPHHYGGIDFTELEVRIGDFGRALGLKLRFFQTNHEGEYVEYLHRLGDLADALVLNPGAWTHYSWAIRDAVEITGLPAIEVHLSDVRSREPWRRVSVLDGLCVATVSGQGVEGYRVALERLRRELAG